MMTNQADELTTRLDVPMQEMRNPTDAASTLDMSLVQPFRTGKGWDEIVTDFRSIFCSTMGKAIELVVCFTIFVLGKVLPSMWFKLYHWESPIPYQVTGNGDVMKELDLSYDVNNETVGDAMLIVLCVVLPFVILIVMAAIVGPKGDGHAALCVFFLATGLNTFLTNTIKIYCGMPRPNFYDLCGFNEETFRCESDRQGDIVQSHRSFPSGHASLAFVSMLTLSLYLLGKVGPHRGLQQQQASYSPLKTKVWGLLSCLPMALAFFIASTRVHDAWHHPVDIVAGAAIGSSCALFVHSLW